MPPRPNSGEPYEEGHSRDAGRSKQRPHGSGSGSPELGRGGLFSFCLTLLLLSGPLKAQDIYATGSVLPAPLYLKWFQEYQAQTGVSVGYRPMGAGNGFVNSPVAITIDFSIGDRPMSEDQMRAAPGCLNLPVAVHAVAVIYNLPGLTAKLRLSGPVIADIYLGRITRWNDSQIARLNPGVSLPDLAVNPVHQFNGGGTTFVLTAYLSAVSPLWNSTVSTGASVHWPVGLGAKQGSGVSEAVMQNPGSIGYEELGSAVLNRAPCAAVQNAKGSFVVPTLESQEAAADAAPLPRDMRGSMVNSPAPLGYPLIGCFYLFVYKASPNPKVKGLVTWILTTGQRDAASFDYAPLPPRVQRQALAAATDIK